MASDIHKKRTGRALKVSEEIVQREEMYEEMEDDMPRPYRHLTSHLQTGSAEFDHRVNAYIASQIAMSTVAKYNEIDKLFNQAFPQAANISQQMQYSQYAAPIYRRSESVAQSPRPTLTPISSRTPCLSPATTTMDAIGSPNTQCQTPQSRHSDVALDPQLAQQSKPSFTSELSSELKTMANVDMNDPMAVNFFGGDGAPLLDFFNNDYNGCLPPHCQLDPNDYNCQDIPDIPEAPGAIYDITASPLKEDLSLPQDFRADDSLQFSISDSMGVAIDGNWESLVDYGNEQ
ncbi:hypothetical protein NUW58_g3942 [Xylaria curta]|uniref:Uncharacterized protein n=1 Tax=Xylaria curta TaxID=42375 RepID=A0ACC1P9X1_9PEZI|nr:hypothetical protein NUW58_g3942 [Xylaria curta]